jgi:hypothetical protein
MDAGFNLGYGLGIVPSAKALGSSGAGAGPTLLPPILNLITPTSIARPTLTIYIADLAVLDYSDLEFSTSLGFSPVAFSPTFQAQAEDLVDMDVAGTMPALTNGTWYVRAKLRRGTAYSDFCTPLTIVINDVAPPTLTAFTATTIDYASGSLNVTTDDNNGSIYWVITASATPPTAAQVRAGQNQAGAAAIKNGSLAITTTGAKAMVAGGLTPVTTYYAYVMHEDANGNRSSVLASSFTTSPALAIRIQEDATARVMEDGTARVQEAT